MRKKFDTEIIPRKSQDFDSQEARVREGNSEFRVNNLEIESFTPIFTRISMILLDLIWMLLKPGKNLKQHQYRNTV